MKMSGGMAVWRGIATADLPARAADPQMNPRAAYLEAFFKTARAWLYRPYGVEVRAAFAHGDLLLGRMTTPAQRYAAGSMLWI